MKWQEKQDMARRMARERAQIVVGAVVIERRYAGIQAKENNPKQMIDIYALISVGIALLLGFLPLRKKKNRSGDFLITHLPTTKEEE